jgi:ATP-dependent Clp protease ATP-binding subunit ClpC
VSGICQAALERAVRDVSSARGVDEPPADDREWVGLFARFTPRARSSITLAQEIARGVPHNYVGTEHLLLGVIDEGTNLAVKVLTAMEVEPDDVRVELVATMPAAGTTLDGQLPFTPLAKRVLENASKEAATLGHNYLGCEHLLLGLVATEDGIASKVLRRMGLELRTTRRAIVTALSGYVHAQNPSKPTPTSGSLDDILRRLDAIEARLAG